MTFLEDRRALYYPLEMEEPRRVVASVQQIRQRLTEDLQKIDRDSELAIILRTTHIPHGRLLHFGDYRRNPGKWALLQMRQLCADGSLRWRMAYTGVTARAT